MAFDNLPENLSFLTDAAHLLIKTAPETSAYLMAQRDSLMFHSDIERSDMQRQHVCGACGHIMISGQGSELKLEADKAIKRKKRSKGINTPKNLDEKKAPAPGCRKRFTCGMCGQYTNISIPPAAPISRRRHSKLTKSLPLHASHLNKPAPVSEPVKASANASSKKRAKSRKQGLQALLQQAQASASKPQNGLGLSLSDFMLK
ncbi:uncharacterized protein GGS22DRAFT_200586 [Annulohypoxylon maeteangense]|uniref:uncharacterized protein n=1 Tax=Annulohypoxylon maeteangense TaxID=1927788 RepID=UPI002007D3FD|nr:uncharacterized protein GGS22DRAFT_200586 [Annulohypoxylon maeteangense]KAI0884931.1 hypothetical protein GGS22DRAFT_200586 [Annulohypoxylon maeteangense]